MEYDDFQEQPEDFSAGYEPDVAELIAEAASQLARAQAQQHAQLRGEVLGATAHVNMSAGEDALIAKYGEKWDRLKPHVAERVGENPGLLSQEAWTNPQRLAE